MKSKEKMIEWLSKNRHIYHFILTHDIKTIVFFRNPTSFRYCHFFIERHGMIYIIFSKKFDRVGCKIIRIGKIILR